MSLYFHCSPSKKISVFVFRGRGRVQVWVNKHIKKIRSLNLRRSHVSIMISVTVIIISLITNIKTAIIIIAIIKNDYHNNNNSNNNSNNNNDNNNNNNNNNMIIIKVLIIVIIFKIITATSIIIIIIITDHYSKLTRSSYRYCFLHSLKNMLFNSVLVCVDTACFF